MTRIQFPCPGLWSAAGLITLLPALALVPHAAQAQTYDYNYTGSVQSLTITPGEAGIYDFTITGADGGSGIVAGGGAGASLQGSLDLAAGTYDVAVGGAGSGGFAGGGGGGTFLYVAGSTTPILAAGGGGGGNLYSGSPGGTTNAFGTSITGGTGGVGNGNGGGAGGGAGFSMNGMNGVNGSGGSGGGGGSDATATDPFAGGTGNGAFGHANGGFGGGGGSGDYGGGGGGYDGGNGGSNGSHRGSGGSSAYDNAPADGYNAQVTTATDGGQVNGNGLLTITAAPAPEPSQMALFALMAAGLGGLVLRAKKKGGLP